MTIRAINTIMTERIWISHMASEIVFQPMYSDTGAPLHEERRVITVRQKLNLHLEVYQRDVTGGMRTPGGVLWQRARDTSCAVDGTDQGSHQRGIAHEDAERCHTDQRGVPRQRHLRFSARDQTSVTSPVRHTRVPRKSKRSPATGSRSVSFSPTNRWAHRHWKHLCAFMVRDSHFSFSGSHRQDFARHLEESSEKVPRAILVLPKR